MKSSECLAVARSDHQARPDQTSKVIWCWLLHYTVLVSRCFSKGRAYLIQGSPMLRHVASSQEKCGAKYTPLSGCQPAGRQSQLRIPRW